MNNRPLLLRLGLTGALVTGSLLAAAPPAAAATIHVACSANALISAVEAANDETTHPGGDTLSLSPGCTYTFTERYAGTEDALPDIVGGLIIDGNGARLERGSDALSFGVADIHGDLVVSDLTLAEFWGFNGAYFFVGGSLVLSDSLITNSPPFGQQDAALEVGPSGTLAVLGSTIENQAIFATGGTGAAIDNHHELVVFDSVFRANRIIAPTGTVSSGNAISNSGTARIFESTFADNFGAATAGAIRNTGYLEVHDSSFTNNNANFGGAIRTTGASDLFVEGSYFADNEADLSGGAIDVGTNSIARITNSTFYRNHADAGVGGAISNAHATRVEWSTFAQNAASGAGDTLSGSSGLIVVEASILSGSTPCDGAITDFGGNIVHPSLGTCPAGFTVGDPHLLSPGLHGGETRTLSLGAGSAAFDHVSATGCPGTDQRGMTRPVGPKCDAGASEDQLPTIPGIPALTGGSSNPNTGQFGLAWAPATDPDGQPLSYRLQHRDADDLFFSVVTTTSAPDHQFTSGTPETEGRFRYRVAADDGNHSSASSAASSVVVVDQSAPSAPSAAADRAPEYVASDSWWRDTVTIGFSGSTDPLLLDGSAGSGVASITADQTFSTSGAHTATGSATDHAGNVSPTTSLTVHVDAEPPDVGFTACPADVILGSSISAAWAASDASSGLATPATGTVPLDTATIGTRTVSAGATDNVGHAATATCTYRTIYDFTGFFKPLANPPAVTQFEAGDRVAVTFTLGGDQGLGVLAAGYPQSTPMACGSTPELTSGDPTRSVRGITFTRGGGGRYTYHWITEAAWAGTCRQLVVQLDDGTYHRANVAFSP